MSGTIQIARDRLAEYFDAFTRRFLRDGSPKAIDVEVLEPPTWATSMRWRGPAWSGSPTPPAPTRSRSRSPWGTIV